MRNPATNTLKYHPFADALPLMEGDEFEALVADIKAHGLRDSLTLYEGKILDGRNRYRACCSLGLDPQTTTLVSGDPVAFVISKNLKRRHLTTQQAALAGAKLCNLKNGQRLDLAIKNEASAGALASTGQMAKLMGVSEDSIKRARTIIQHGTPEELADIKEGKANLRETAEKVRKRKKKNKHGRSHEQEEALEEKRILYGMWNDLRAAVETLSEMPTPSDIVGDVKKVGNASSFIDRRLAGAVKWLNGFSDAWQHK
jgi:hypothetical protein